MRLIKVLSIIGFLLSCYALYVKCRISNSKDYKPICDISEHISCTRAFTSKYGKVARVPNPVYGIFFYSIVFIWALLGLKGYIFYLLILSSVGTIFLAYISYFKQKNFCLVCTSIYLINILLLILSAPID